jgi:hypothetical protein
MRRRGKGGATDVRSPPGEVAVSCWPGRRGRPRMPSVRPHPFPIVVNRARERERARRRGGRKRERRHRRWHCLAVAAASGVSERAEQGRKGEGERWREVAGEAEAQRDGRADSGGAAWQGRAASRLRRGELEAGTAVVSAVRGERDGFDSDAPGTAAPVAAALATPARRTQAAAAPSSSAVPELVFTDAFSTASSLMLRWCLTPAARRRQCRPWL